MPPRPRHSPDDIVQAGLALVRQQGFDALTARSLATALGCSTGPLFTHFDGMEPIQQAVLAAAMDRFVACAARPVDPDPLVAAGLGWLGFAVDEPRLYQALFLRAHPWHRPWGALRRRLAEGMGEHPRYAALDLDARFALVGRASVVLHGLGLELWAGRLSAPDEPSRRLLLSQLVLPVVDAAVAAGWTTDFHSLSTRRQAPLSRTA